MSNTLYKNTNIAYLPGSPGTIGDPGQLARPAYTAYVNTTVCEYVVVQGGDAGSFQYLLDDKGQYQYVWVPSGGVSYGSYSVGSLRTEYVCTTKKVPVYYPAQPYIAPTPSVAPTPEQTTYDFNLGWNSGARSLGFLLGDGYVSFYVPYSLVGGVLGLNNIDADAGYYNIEHSFYFSGKTARVYESGSEVHFIGDFADDDLFKISRRAGVVEYYQDDTLVYTSAVPSTGTVFLDSSLYAGGDYVYDPVISGYASVEPDVATPESNFATLNGNLQPLTGTSSNFAYASSLGEMLPLTSIAGVFSGSNGLLSPLTGLGGSAMTTLVSWPPGTYPTSGNGTVVGVITGGLLGGDLTGGVFAGQLTSSDGTAVGNIQADASGSDTGTGFSGGYIGVITDTTTGAVIGYVSGVVAGTGAGTTSYAAGVTGSANYVLLPVDSIGVVTTVTGDLAGTVGGDGAFSATLTGTLTDPVTGAVVGIITGTVTGYVDGTGTYVGTYVGTVTDPITGAIIGVYVGVVSGTGTLTTVDGVTTLTDTGVVGTGTFVLTDAPTIITVSTYGDSYGVLQPLTTTSGSLPPPPAYALASGALGVLIGAANCLTGEVGGGATELIPIEGGIVSDRPYAESRGVLVPLVGYSSAYEGNLNASMGNIAVATGNMIVQRVLMVTMTSTGTVTSVQALDLAIDADLVSDVSAATSMAVTRVLNTIMQSTVAVGAVLPANEQDSIVYVVNADSKATSTYEDFPFNSYAQIDGAYFGLKADGLFLLEGVDDDGSPVRASISFGKHNFGSTARKRMAAAYLGVASTGAMLLKITTPEGSKYVYTTRRDDDFQRTQRVDVGRGITATYLTFELFNKDGADFELDSVEFQAVELTRKV